MLAKVILLKKPDGTRTTLLLAEDECDAPLSRIPGTRTDLGRVTLRWHKSEDVPEGFELPVAFASIR